MANHRPQLRNSSKLPFFLALQLALQALRQADDMGACSKGEDKGEGQQKQKIRCEGQTSRLQDTALAPPSTATLIIHLKVQAGGTDWTEQANKLGAIGDLKLILGHKCGIPEHELPFCKHFLAIWFSGYPLDDNKTIEECGELCDVYALATCLLS